MHDWNTVLGINARNAMIAGSNPNSAIRLVNNKQATKDVMLRIGNRVAPTLFFIKNKLQLRSFDLTKLPESWVVKPNQSLAGQGVLLATQRQQEGWLSGSGKSMKPQAIIRHLLRILDGEHSPIAQDAALFEPLLHAHSAMQGMAPIGLPDIRVICYGDQPQLAMVRLPTKRSGGRANLHAGGIGVSIDLSNGRTLEAFQKRRRIVTHPDTGSVLNGIQIPYWAEILEMSARCAPATGLQYVGVDIVIDEILGPVILEVNARPGLEIQNITRSGLFAMLFDDVRRRQLS